MLSICCVSRPKVAVVVVKKRINSRFFANDRGGLGNPMSGTIVDTEATRPEWWVHRHIVSTNMPPTVQRAPPTVQRASISFSQSS